MIATATHEHVQAVVVAAQRLVAAADRCDREAENHPSSRSSAPVVGYINAMARLRDALARLPNDWLAP